MKRTHLTQQQRYHIQAMLEQGYTKQDIAKRLNKRSSTISREIQRNSSNGIYHAPNAQKQAQQRKIHNRSAYKLTKERIEQIHILLNKKLSPEQICGYLHEYHGISLHHETLYRYLAKDKRNNGNLYQQL